MDTWFACRASTDESTAAGIHSDSSLMARSVRNAQSQGSDPVVIPELALMGYLSRELFMSPGVGATKCRG